MLIKQEEKLCGVNSSWMGIPKMLFTETMSPCTSIARSVRGLVKKFKKSKSKRKFGVLKVFLFAWQLP